MSNSNLVTYTQLSPYHSGNRTQPISRFSPHCYVGQITVERAGKGFEHRDKGKEASCNYVVDTNGRIALIVPEGYRSWCTSSAYNDQRAITVECASDASEPYAFNDKVWASLIKLAIDCCKRNGKDTFVYIPDKDEALKYKPKDNEMLMTFHRWYKSTKKCPGDWFVSRAQDFADAVNEGLKGYTEVPLYHKAQPGEGLYRIAAKYGLSKAEIKRLNPWCKAPMYLVPLGKQVRIK